MPPATTDIYTPYRVPSTIQPTWDFETRTAWYALMIRTWPKTVVELRFPEFADKIVGI